eukprot:GHVU01152619.1.p1 GENE.GHVU01152619.1~~GHVU01152619.1.p1  ORF type:complete len:427 (+),score=50.40 GHVU01152619.1:780-2060(+)
MHRSWKQDESGEERSGVAALEKLRPCAHRRLLHTGALSQRVYSYYSDTFSIVKLISAHITRQHVQHIASKEIEAAIRRRHRYRRCVQSNTPAPCRGVGIADATLRARVGMWKTYCPVRWHRDGVLLNARSSPHVVEFENQVYFLSSYAALQDFLLRPGSFLRMPLPLPSKIPLRLSSLAASTATVALKAHCPVVLAEKKELVRPVRQDFVVWYHGQHWVLSSLEALERFMRTPSDIVMKAVLPEIIPEDQLRDRLASNETERRVVRKAHEDQLNSKEEASDMESLQEALQWLQKAASDAITDALVHVGVSRYLLPGRSMRSSASMGFARHLHANNPQNPRRIQRYHEEQFRRFVQDCALPVEIRECIQRRRDAEAEEATRPLNPDPEFVTAGEAGGEAPMRSSMQTTELEAKIKSYMALLGTPAKT